MESKVCRTCQQELPVTAFPVRKDTGRRRTECQACHNAKQIEEHIRYLDQKLGRLNAQLEQIAGGVLDDRDAAADLRDRLQRELDARELV